MRTEDWNSYLDLSLLEDYIGQLGKKTVGQMLSLYKQQAEIYLGDIRQAQLIDSSNDWQVSCHKMKGAAASVGMVQLHTKLKLLEKIEANHTEKGVYLSELALLNEEGITALTSWLESL